MSKKGMHSLHYSVAVLVLLVLGIGSALILSQQSQDSRGSADSCTLEMVNGKQTRVCRQDSVNLIPAAKSRINSAPPTSNKTSGIAAPDRTQKTDNVPVTGAPQSENSNSISADRTQKPSSATSVVQKAAQTVSSWLGLSSSTSQESDPLSKTAGTPSKSGSETSTQRMTQAQIDAENVAAAQAKKAAGAKTTTTGTSNTGSAAPTSGGSGSSGGTGGSSGTTNAALSPEVLYTQQIFRELIGRVPPTTDKDFNTLVGLVRENNCLAVVQAFYHNDDFNKRKNNSVKEGGLNNLDYARMIHRVLVSRNMSPNDESNGWVQALNNGMTREQLVTSISGFEEPKAACAARRLITN